MSHVADEHCPLCSASENHHFYQDLKRSYLRCHRCLLVFVSVKQRLALEKEHQQYDLHQNDVNDANYRKFLSRIYTPISKLIAPPANVLDFGCGPGPALAAMFSENGYSSEVYDPYFYPDKSVLNKKYQIITLTEVLEHMFYPLKELLRLKSLLTDDGLIGIMTKRLIDEERFADWHYKNDPTHVCFYSDDSLRWLANRIGLELEISGEDSIILRL